LKESRDGETLVAVVPDLGSSRGESMTSKVSFCPGKLGTCRKDWLDELSKRLG